MTDYRYKAFVSYSWADAPWGKWLLHALETYHTPKALVGKDGTHGPVAARLIPLFKDREEEAAGASIGKAVEAALATSEFLIVICSPNSAASKWVNHELAWFKTHRDPDRILALIVDGEPGSRGKTECFPKALTHRVLADLSVTGEPEDAPLAADARDSGDGKRKARLKLAAALLGVGLDELVGRDDRRRALRQRWVTAASLLFGGSMAALAWTAVQARNEADLQRAESDGLVEFMLTDLREKLEPVGRLDALDVVGQRALKYYAGQKPGNLDADALGRRSRALHLVGEIRNIRGDSAAGLAAFRQAAATTGELLARDPGNAQRIFDHAQSVFWVGYIAYERGEAKEAEAQFREYKRLADRLVALDPMKPDWQMEASYAESNLGILLSDQGRYAEAEPPLARALAMVETVAASEGFPIARQLEVGVAINWLSQTRAAINRIPEALALDLRQIALYQGVLKVDPANTQAKWLMAVAWQNVGELNEIRGHGVAAGTAFVSSLDLMRQLRVIEPDNTEWQETEVRAQLMRVEHEYYSGRLNRSRSVLLAAQAGIERLIATDPKNAIWSVGLRSMADQRAAQLQLAEGHAGAALKLADDVHARLQTDPASVSAGRISLWTITGLVAGDALAAMGKRREAQARWQLAFDRIGADPASGQLRVRRARYLLLRRLGLRRQAVDLAAELDRQGDRHPAYLRER